MINRVAERPAAATEDTSLIQQALRQDTLAWEQLIRRYQEPVFRLAYLLLGDAAEADDVAQETFIRAYLHLGQFDASRPLRPWLLQITANLARNRHRSLSRYWEALRRLWQSQLNEDETDDLALAQQQAQTLWRAVRQLRREYQETVYLRYFLELSEAEVAETLRIAPGTVKSRLHRAIKQLRGVIELEFPELVEREAWCVNGSRSIDNCQ